MAYMGSSNETAIKSLLSQLFMSGMPSPESLQGMDLMRLQEQLRRSNRDIEELDARIRDDKKHPRDWEGQRDRSYQDDLETSDLRGQHRSNFFGGALDRSKNESWQHKGRWGSRESFRDADVRRPSRFDDVGVDRRTYPSLDAQSTLNSSLPIPNMFASYLDPTRSSSGSSMWSSMNDAARQGYLYGVDSTLVKPLYSLEPPPAGQSQPSASEKPLGCHTIFVGGLPDHITEDLLREIFFACGVVKSVRITVGKGGKKFAHLRFVDAESVDLAVGYSGYKLYLGTGDERTGGRIYVDYAKSREDEKEYEMLLRAKEREARHKQDDIEKTMVAFSESAASDLMQSIRSSSGFDESFKTLAHWLEKGECTRRTSSTFYNLLCNVHNHIKRLVKEKKEHEEIVERQKLEQEERAKLIMGQGAAIMKIFKAASKKRCWDHFSKAQRRNIDEWHQQVEKEIKISEEEQMEKRWEVGMDLDEESEENTQSTSEPEASQTGTDETGESEAKKVKTEESEEDKVALEAQDIKFRAQNASLRALAEKNTSLMWEVEGYKKDIVDLKQKFASVFQDKDLQIARLMTAIQGLQSFLQNVPLNASETNPAYMEVEVEKESTETGTETGIESDSIKEQTTEEQTATEQHSAENQEEMSCEPVEPPKVEQKKSSIGGKKGVRTRRSRRKKEKEAVDEEEVVKEADEDERQETHEGNATESTSSVGNDQADSAETKVKDETQNASEVTSTQSSVVRLTSHDMRIVGLLCSYLQICPYGATTEQVLYHIQRHVPGVTFEGLEIILEGLPMIFAGDGLEFYNKTWKFKQV